MKNFCNIEMFNVAILTTKPTTNHVTALTVRLYAMLYSDVFRKASLILIPLVVTSVLAEKC